MRIGKIEVIPLASESMGVRSLCTFIRTPDLAIILDPSAALAMRERLEPHPLEYRKLLETLQAIFVESRKADILSISHYHYDHVRPGFTNFRYNLSSREELQRLVEGKLILAKDNRENINPSQRRRGYFFQKDIEDLVKEIRWSDGQTFDFGGTKVICSQPLSHGPSGSRLGFVISTTIECEGHRVLFAPDVQGPVDPKDLSYVLSMSPDLAIIGGPPIYLKRFGEEHSRAALHSMTRIVSEIPMVVLDHHLMRSKDWENWLHPVAVTAEKAGNNLLTMAKLAGIDNTCLESMRATLYADYPPSSDFLAWTAASEEYKMKNLPPLNEFSD
ncbi:MAG: hypothetical protein ACFFD6_00705 [Candidatus Thorarchaeota archaeon]